MSNTVAPRSTMRREHFARARSTSSLSATLRKVAELPSPTTGIVSPLDGMGRAISGARASAEREPRPETERRARAERHADPLAAIHHPGIP